jgi:hypothetical protein
MEARERLKANDGGDNLLRKNRRCVTLLPMTSLAFRIGQTTSAPFRGIPAKRRGREKISSAHAS